MHRTTHARNNMRRRLSAPEEQRKLVAAEAVQLLGRAQRALGHACERAQDVVADCVAKTVVGVFEVVEIEQRKTEGRPIREERVESFVERATVRQAGQRVAARLGERERELSLPRQRSGGGPLDSAGSLGPHP